MPNLYLKYGDAEEVDVSDIIENLCFLGLDTSPVLANVYQENNGSDGVIPRISTYGKAVVTANFYLRFRNYEDFRLAKRQIYGLFSQKGMYRLRTEVEPCIIYKVLSMPFDVKPKEQGAKYALFSIPYENPSGYSYSLQRSDQLDDWQLGMNIPFDKEVDYRFTTKNFQVYNASDISIDPYRQKHDLKIICKFVGSKLTIENETTGTQWTYNVSSDGKQQIVLDGIRTLLDGQPASKNTDYGHITLAKGWNELVVSGATTSDITFSFPFIYLA